MLGFFSARQIVVVRQPKRDSYDITKEPFIMGAVAFPETRRRY